jgi:hypothetical protein
MTKPKRVASAVAISEKKTCRVALDAALAINEFNIGSFEACARLWTGLA